MFEYFLVLMFVKWLTHDTPSTRSLQNNEDWSPCGFLQNTCDIEFYIAIVTCKLHDKNQNPGYMMLIMKEFPCKVSRLLSLINFASSQSSFTVSSQRQINRTSLSITLTSEPACISCNDKYVTKKRRKKKEAIGMISAICQSLD